MDKVLFVDDEPEYVADYRDELEKSFDVDFCQTADESVEKILQNDSYAAVVLDVQMPQPKNVSPAATNNGVDTGLWVLGQVKQSILEKSLPVILLTNRNPDVVRSLVEQMGLADHKIEIRPKTNTAYEKLPKLVNDMLPHLVKSEATLARMWHENSCALCVNNDRVGWLEFDVSTKALPKDARVGDRFDVLLKIDRHDKVVSYQIPAGAKLIQQSEDTFGKSLSKGIPKLPQSLDDAEAVARYRRELANWTQSSGLK